MPCRERFAPWPVPMYAQLAPAGPGAGPPGPAEGAPAGTPPCPPMEPPVSTSRCRRCVMVADLDLNAPAWMLR